MHRVLNRLASYHSAYPSNLRRPRKRRSSFTTRPAFRITFAVHHGVRITKFRRVLKPPGCHCEPVFAFARLVFCENGHCCSCAGFYLVESLRSNIFRRHGAQRDATWACKPNRERRRDKLFCVDNKFSDFDFILQVNSSHVTQVGVAPRFTLNPPSCF